jgi:hypothetical protein
VQPTRYRDLAVVAGVVGVLAYLLVSWTYHSLPRLPRTAPASLLLVGLVEVQTAAITRRRLRREPGTKPIAPLTVARLVVLAKASSLTGAALAGGWAGVLAYTAARTDEFGTATSDAVTAAMGVGAAVILIVGGLLLEHVCRVPRDGPRRPAGGGGDAA